MRFYKAHVKILAWHCGQRSQVLDYVQRTSRYWVTHRPMNHMLVSLAASNLITAWANIAFLFCARTAIRGYRAAERSFLKTKGWSLEPPGVDRQKIATAQPSRVETCAGSRSCHQVDAQYFTWRWEVSLSHRPCGGQRSWCGG